MNYIKLINNYLRREKHILYIVILVTLFLYVFIIKTSFSIEGLLFLSAFLLFFVGRYCYKRFMLLSNYYQLSKNEKLRLNEDLQLSLIFNGKDYAISKNFIVDYKNCSIIPLDSILIIEQIRGKYSPSVRSHNIVDVVYLYTKSGRTYRLINRSYQYYLYDNDFGFLV